jgi:fatty-acyl-CoA synthase
MTSQNELRELNAARRGHWVNQVQRHAIMHPDKEALEFEDTILTWAEFYDRIRRLAAVYRRFGVSFGDRVAVAMGNRHQFLEAVLAANYLGAMAVPVNFRFSAGEMTYAFEDSGALLVVSDDTTRSTVLTALTQTNHGLAHITVGDAAEGVTSYEEAIAAPGRVVDPIDVPEDTPALIMYTSGTTGAPKGAVLTLRNLISQADVLVRACGGFHDDDVLLISSPLFHIGAVGTITPGLQLGLKSVIYGSKPFDAPEVLGLLRDKGIAFTFMVPTQWQILCDAAAGQTVDLPALRILGWGAAPATDKLLATMLETFPQGSPVAFFGQSEMSPVTCVLDGRDARRKLGSVGKPVPQVQVRVVDPAMQDVAPGEVGEIVYRGSGLMKEYWNKPEETAKAFDGGWFHSGDLVYCDPEGFYYVVDRIKDMVISGGENIYCAEVENALSTHPAVHEVSIIGKPHHLWGETPVAFVVLNPGVEELTIEELRTHGSQRLAKFKLPTALVVVDELPRNTSGKILKGKLRERTAAE